MRYCGSDGEQYGVFLFCFYIAVVAALSLSVLLQRSRSRVVETVLASRLEPRMAMTVTGFIELGPPVCVASAVA
jgi:hypothetical protein